MGNLFSALNISASALNVHQSAVDIISNNIANINTEGYSKQKVNLGTLAIGTPIGNNVNSQVNTSIGVEMINVERYTTTFDKSYYRDEITKQAYLSEQVDSLTNISDMFDTLKGNGLDSAMQDFYTALDNLNQFPTDSSARISFVDAASTLADKMNNISSKLDELKNQSVGDGKTQESLENSELFSAINCLNKNLEDLTNVNKMLSTSHGGTLENNNLLDKRDSILKEISKYGDFDTDIQENGTVNLSIDGSKLVSGVTLAGTFNAENNSTISLTKNDETIIPNVDEKFKSGKIGAILETPKNINSVINNLDSLAQSIANEFNNIQTRDGAYYIDNTDGKMQLSNANIDKYKIFTTNDQTDSITASNISVNNIFKQNDGYNKIATAYFEKPENTDLYAVGNANNIKEMIGTKDSLNNTYNTILSKTISATTSKTNSLTTQNNVVQSLDNKIKSQTGVDMNEELADLVKYQTAMEASARVFSVCNEMLDTLVHLGE